MKDVQIDSRGHSIGFPPQKILASHARQTKHEPSPFLVFTLFTLYHYLYISLLPIQNKQPVFQTKNTQSPTLNRYTNILERVW